MPRNLDCPACAAATVKLPRFTHRRRRPVTCTNCGARLERVLPSVPYYTLAFVIGVLAEAAVLAVLVLAALQEWAWIVATILGVLAANVAVSVFLNARTRVEFAEQADARRGKPFAGTRGSGG